MSKSAWYCIVVSSTCFHGNSDKVIDELKGVFRDSLKSILVINHPDITKTGEYYVFVEGKGLMKEKENVQKLSCVNHIVSISDVPYEFSEKEIEGFRKSIEKKDTSVTFKKGDVVLVKDGFLKNLFGLVVGKKGGCLKVMFKFHVRSFFEVLDPKNLKKEKNIFDYQPSNIDRDEWFKKFTE